MDTNNADKPPLKHKWDERDVCIYCRNTRVRIEEKHIASCRKPRFGQGAPGGFGAPNFAGPKVRDDDLPKPEQK